MPDVDLLAAALRRDFAVVEPSDAPEWRAPAALRVIDCVLSLNRHYDRFVVPRRDDLAQRHPEVQTVSQLRALIAAHSSPEAFLEQELRYRDPLRARILVAVADFLLDVVVITPPILNSLVSNPGPRMLGRATTSLLEFLDSV